MDLEDRARIRWKGGNSQIWPHRRWRQRVIGTAMALGLVATGGILGKIGTIDAFRALTYGGRVAGVSFIAGAMIEMLAAFAVLDYWRRRQIKYSAAAVLFGVLVAVAAHILLLLVHIYGGEYTYYLWLWPTLLVWSLWALWVLHRQHVWKAIPHPRGLTVGVVASAVLAAGNLAYSQVYLPYASNGAFRLSIDFGKPTLDQGMNVLHLPARLRYKNDGDVRLYVLGGMWRMYGLSTNFSESAREMKDWKRDINPPYELDFRRNSAEADWDLIDSGGFSAPGDWLEPGDDFKHERLVEIPVKSEFDIIHVDLELAMVRGDRGTLDQGFAGSWKPSWDLETLKHQEDAPEWVADSGDEYIRYQSRIFHSNEILNVTRSPRYVTVWRVIPDFSDDNPAEKDDTDPYQRAIIAPSGKEGEYREGEQSKIWNRFGMSFVYGGSAAQVSFQGLINAAKEG
ncbi:hypothetical protein OTC26_004620 [Streptomyces tirandamycinicus]|uniref:hypothetical protein n=1 Tax=Streptomyces tirandamycinicus TaxID=2174846 RepID=UPI002270BE0F|nr:hypothetical protein [Streptomyces tirandamycinicus]MCY0984741.1 hypothetical protein [Streptomyces tirandamycinicus]